MIDLKNIEADVSPEMNEKLERYMDEILRYNESINLTAIRERDEFVTKHIVDSLLFADLPCIKEADKIIDAGTGAGFPGVPLAIVYPEKEFVLLDSLAKKLKIVSDIADELGIENVSTLHMRAEDAGKDKAHRERYEVCVTRALAPLPVLLEYTLPLIRPGGKLVAYKGPQYEEELADAKKALDILGGELVSIEHSGLEDMDRTALVISKTGKTPAQYPRKAGTPSKKPL